MSQSPAPEASKPDVTGLSVGILGGTGDQGRGLGRRLALAGHRVIIGSRSEERAEKAASELREGDPGLDVVGMANAGCAAAGDVVIIAVPWEGHDDLLRSLASELASKVVVDCVNPLGFDKQGPHAIKPTEGSAAEQAAAILTGSRVVAAFHHVSAVLLLDPSVDAVDLDVLVLGDDREATDLVRRWPSASPAFAASSPVGCATPTRSRR